MVSVFILVFLLSSPAFAQDAPVQPDQAPQAVTFVDEDSFAVLTNREAAAMLADAMDLEGALWQGLFSDVGEGSESAGIIEALALAGVVKGTLDGFFEPDDVISRAEFAVWLDRAFYRDVFEPEPAPFTDIPEGAVYEASVHKLHAAGIVVGCLPNQLMFCGEDNLTLGQAEDLLAKVKAKPYLISDCQEPGNWLLLCEVYEHIDADYVLDTTLDDLVAPVAEAVAGIEQERDEEAGRREQFDCSIPAPDFEPVCSWALLTPETPIRELAETVVRAVVMGLDPNSAYHDAEEWSAIEERGRYTGIGVRVVTVDDQWQAGCSPLSAGCRMLILTVFEGGPAHAAGFAIGDFIVAVDGESLDGMTLGEVVGLIRGEVDTPVDITIERHGAKHRFTLIRKDIVVPYTSADFHDTESVAYLQLTSFSPFPGGAVAEFRDRLAAAADYQLLILDLRNNGGGSVEVLQGIAGALVGEAPVLTIHTREEIEIVEAIGTPILGAETPRLAILVNGFSASASEVLAGMLQEAGRATVIGETTFKKNTGQSLFELFNDGVLRLTTIRWTTPGGIDIGETGVPLDIEVEFSNMPVRDLIEWVKSLLDNPPEEEASEISKEE